MRAPIRSTHDHGVPMRWRCWKNRRLSIARRLTWTRGLTCCSRSDHRTVDVPPVRRRGAGADLANITGLARRRCLRPTKVARSAHVAMALCIRCRHVSRRHEPRHQKSLPCCAPGRDAKNVIDIMQTHNELYGVIYYRVRREAGRAVQE